eukprot:3165614-Prymnesium_polylepis.1
MTPRVHRQKPPRACAPRLSRRAPDGGAGAQRHSPAVFFPRPAAGGRRQRGGGEMGRFPAAQAERRLAREADGLLR